jgi:hypothetical protein
LQAGLDFQDRLARFLENHDEPRAAAVFPPEIHRAAAVISFFTPGLRFFHQGQLEGARKKVPVHLGRGPREAVDESLREFYDRLLTALQDKVVRTGEWQLLDCQPAWEGNATHDDFIACAWSQSTDDLRLVTVNYGSNQGQCHVRPPWPQLIGRRWRLQDRLGDAVYERDGEQLLAPGLYLDLPPWGYHVFTLDAVD